MIHHLFFGGGREGGGGKGGEERGGREGGGGKGGGGEERGHWVNLKKAKEIKLK